MATTIGSASGESEIAQLWRNHYESLLNSTNVSSDEKLGTVQKIKHRVIEDKIFQTDISNAVQKLKLGKSRILMASKVKITSMQAIGCISYSCIVSMQCLSMVICVKI